MRRTFVRLLAALALVPSVLVALVIACGGNDPAPLASRAPSPHEPTRATGELLLASTTSTEDSGLLDVLLPAFEAASGYAVKLISGGSGQALANGRRGDVDVLLVHSPDAEQAFVADGDGIERALVMRNDFVVVGPETDPANVAGATSAADALAAIAAANARFISRGDDSGTHVLERKLWDAAGIAPGGKPWYEESGVGQGATLQIAGQKDAYALTDRGTFIALRGRLGLRILQQGGEELLNVYHVIVVNPQKHPAVDATAARAFARWIVAGEAQRIIREFGTEQYGEPLFDPDAGEPDSIP